LISAGVVVEIFGFSVLTIDLRGELEVALSQKVSGSFGLTVSGEDAFLVATNAGVS
jgi:hypothetical protein